jgi:phosphatidylinositol glycan class O
VLRAAAAESLAAQAGPGGPYADTLLLVLSDHGQTLGGDHGGGTPDETDSVLLAASLRKMHDVLQRRTNGAVDGDADVPVATLDASGRQQQQQDCGTRCHTGIEQSLGSSPVFQRLMRTGGYMLGDAAQAQNCSDSSSSGSGSVCQDAGVAGSCQQQHWPWLCSSSMSQIDLTPTIAHLLGVPIPFGNLGKLPPHLFAALAVNSSTDGAGSPTEAWLSQYAAALHANAQQVIHNSRYTGVCIQQSVAADIIHQCCGAAFTQVNSVLLQVSCSCLS